MNFHGANVIGPNPFLLLNVVDGVISMRRIKARGGAIMLIFLLVILLILLIASDAPAQAPYYQGKTVTVIVGSSARPNPGDRKRHNKAITRIAALRGTPDVNSLQHPTSRPLVVAVAV